MIPAARAPIQEPWDNAGRMAATANVIPQADHPQTDRPQTDRPQTDRPQTDHPQTERWQFPADQTDRKALGQEGEASAPERATALFAQRPGPAPARP